MAGDRKEAGRRTTRLKTWQATSSTASITRTGWTVGPPIAEVVENHVYGDGKCKTD